MTKWDNCSRTAPRNEGFSDPGSEFRVTIAAYAMANKFLPVSSGIDLDWSGLVTAISVALQRASSKSACEEIARRVAVNRKTKDG